MPKKSVVLDGGGLFNSYDIMPEKFKPVVKNPNKHLHGLELPLRMIVSAPSGSGKTNFVANLLALFSAGEGSFSEIKILSKNLDEPIYQWLKSKSKDIIFKEGLKGNMPKLDDTEEKDEQKLIILDDLVLERDLSQVESWFTRCRKFGWSIIFITQSWFRVPKTIRLNVNYVAILKIGSKRDLNLILNEVSIGVTKEQLISMYEHATNKKLDVLLIHVEKNPSERFRHNFLAVMNPKAFTEELLGGDEDV